MIQRAAAFAGTFAAPLPEFEERLFDGFFIRQEQAAGRHVA